VSAVEGFMGGQPITRRIHEREVASLLAKPARTREECVSGRIPFLARLDGRCLARVKATTLGACYGSGTVLFAEEHRPDGVYVILEGHAKLSVSSRNGKSLVLGFCGPGSVLGLEGAILGWPYMATAEIVEPAKVACMTRRDLLRHLGRSEEAALEAAELVSETCYFLLRRIKANELSESAQERLARFLLDVHPGRPGADGETGGKLNLTQEAIGQMIGTSRETVARLLARLKKRGILDWGRSKFTIRDRGALEKLVESGRTDGDGVEIAG
jgi:CRP/FNR family cyclic AMP-dependent transcriptional regulator